MNNIGKMGGFLLAVACGQANQNGIALLDVKSLYDDAYAEKARARACLRSFKSRLVKAEKLDAAYRAQLANSQAHLYRKGGAAWL